MTLAEILDRLEAAYGRPKPPKLTDPFEMILHESVAYLASDEQREKAFDALRRRVGTKPKQILAAPPAALLEATVLGGMLPEQRVRKLLCAAQIAVEKFQGDLRKALALPTAQARKALKLFPGIGDPGAEKILLFSGTLPVLALESNGLRVLMRLGYGEEQKNYAATYRSAQGATKDQIRAECRWLIRAHQLLRRHGQETCKRSGPLCEQCPLTETCRYYERRSQGQMVSTTRL